MKERPILFSAPMVRAILAGTKTQTRRIVKPSTMPRWPELHPEMGDILPLCPYGQPGGRLWARETWRVRGGQEYEYQQDRSQVMYRATHREDGFPIGWESYKWRPSIYMPRWASRITLEVTGVRVERLQDISEADASAEGVPNQTRLTGYGKGDGCQWGPAEPVAEYRALWESINGPGSWDANPWVWVVEFKREGGER